MRALKECIPIVIGRAGAVRPSLAEGAIDGWIEALRWHVSDAVRKRLDDGVIAGLTFSGGLDSSAILAFSCSMAPERVTTYSAVDRGNPGCPETTAIDRVLATKRVRSVQVDVADMHAYGALALQLVAAAPRFVAGRNGFLAMFDHMAAGSGADVMMNGLDADCLFGYGGLIERQVTTGGYKQALHDARKLDRLSGGPWMVPEVRRARLTARLPWALRLQVRSLRSRLAESRRLHDALLRNDVVKRLQLRSRLRAMRQLTRQAVPLQRHVPASDLMNPYTLDGIGRFHTRTRHYGIEMRCPFLDRALIDFAAWIPLELRMRHGRLKWILRKAMDPVLPHDVTWRGDKFHPGSHFDRVMLEPVLEQMVRDFHGSGPATDAFIDRDRFLEAAARWKSGQMEAVWELKMVLLLEYWLQHNDHRVAWGC